jgi:molybdate transport system substrate-binding protein
MLRRTALIFSIFAALVWLAPAWSTPAWSTPARAADPQLIVYAAVSLTDVLNEVAEAYVKTGKPKPVFSYAASSALARQIENGAPAGIFISADEAWMNYIADRKLVAAGTRASFLGNTLVLIAPADRAFKIDITPGFLLAQALGSGKLSMADPDSVPAGRYGKAALENLGVWRDVERHVVRSENVRGALAFVERGEAVAGIVYATDAAVAKKVAVVGVFPPASHAAISYPIGVVAAHDTSAARDFYGFINGDAAKAIFVKYGFMVK